MTTWNTGSVSVENNQIYCFLLLCLINKEHSNYSGHHSFMIAKINSMSITPICEEKGSSPLTLLTCSLICNYYDLHHVEQIFICISFRLFSFQYSARLHFRIIEDTVSISFPYFFKNFSQHRLATITKETSIKGPWIQHDCVVWIVCYSKLTFVSVMEKR